MSDLKPEHWGELVGGYDIPNRNGLARGGQTKRIEVRIKPADGMHPRPVLLILRHTHDGRAFSIPIFARDAREFGYLVDVAVKKLAGSP